MNRQAVQRRHKHTQAAAFIFAHNHPSGETEPSESDKDVTRNLTFAGKIMEMKVLDHLIIGENNYFSFRTNRESR